MNEILTIFPLLLTSDHIGILFNIKMGKDLSIFFEHFNKLPVNHGIQQFTTYYVHFQLFEIL